MSATIGRFWKAARRKLWVVPIVALVAGGGLWWLRARAPRPLARATGARATGGVPRVADPMQYVRSRLDVENVANVNDLVQAYGHWASRADAREARLAIARALLSHGRMQVGLEALSMAVEADPTPRSEDPLWKDLVDATAALWDASTLPYGRDLVQIETRPKARDLVLESLAEVRPERLTAAQRPLLASDFIDLYAGLHPDQRPAIDRALHALAGSDVVEILAGRGITEASSTTLNVAQERQRVLDDVKRNPVPEAPPEE